MAGSDLIDMSLIAPPDAVQVPSINAIFTEWLDKVIELDPEFNAFLESDPTYKHGEAYAYRSTIIYQHFNEKVLSVMLATAKKNDLDQLGANFNMVRLVVQAEDLSTIPPTPAILEGDEAFRRRIQLSWARLSTAGPKASYIYHIISAAPELMSAEVYGPETHGKPGYVDVYLLSTDTEDGTPSQETIRKVSDRLNNKEIRPLTDFVNVYPATISKYNVIARLDIPDGPDRETVYQAALKNFKEYVGLTRNIGAKLSLSGIYKSLHISGVNDVDIEEPVTSLPGKPGVSFYCEASDIQYDRIIIEDGDR